MKKIGKCKTEDEESGIDERQRQPEKERNEAAFLIPPQDGLMAQSPPKKYNGETNSQKKKKTAANFGTLAKMFIACD